MVCSYVQLRYLEALFLLILKTPIKPIVYVQLRRLEAGWFLSSKAVFYQAFVFLSTPNPCQITIPYLSQFLGGFMRTYETHIESLQLGSYKALI